MTDEAVEAVARAIAQSDGEHWYPPGRGDKFNDGHRRRARAAITAYEANRTDVKELREALEEARGIIMDQIKAVGEGRFYKPGIKFEPIIGKINALLTRISSLEKKGS